MLKQLMLCLGIVYVAVTSPLPAMPFIPPVAAIAFPPATQLASSETHWLSLELTPGETLAALFERHELSRNHLYQMLALDNAKAQFRKIRPGQTIRARVDESGGVYALHLLLNPLQEFHIARGLDGAYQAEVYQRPVETRRAVVSGTINSSLFNDGKQAGLSDKQVMEMLAIFRWDIDFALDLQEGDHFRVLFDEHWYRGEKVATGRIQAAEFVNREHRYSAVFYQSEDGGIEGYYTPRGHSLRKAFIRTPVKVGRVTSGFTLRRYHPVLHRFRAHRGVDYGASTGTPVYATGNGRVTFRGRKGGYGNTVILSHWNDYSTLYAHLSRFAKGLKNGQRVKQGQLIGYVGSSGLATGPHLHYEFRVKGKHKNPLTVKLPNAEPLPAEFRADFLQHAALLTAQLQQRTQVAQLQTEGSEVQ